MKKIPTSEIVAYDWKSDGAVWTQPTSRFNDLIQAAFFDQMKGIINRFNIWLGKWIFIQGCLLLNWIEILDIIMVYILNLVTLNSQ